MPTPKPPARIVSDRLEPSVQRRLIAAIESIKGSLDLTAIEEAIRTGSLAEVQRVIDRLSTSLGPTMQVLNQAFEQTGVLAASHLSTQLSRTIAFDAVNPRAVAWAARNAGRLITAISEETRQAIRSMIRESLSDGITMVRTARRIRDVIGLTDGLSDAVINYGRRLIEDGKAEGIVDAAMHRYSNKLLKYRSEVIARTEIITASVKGQDELWRQAVDAGQLDPSVTMRVWIVTPDDRLCAAICAPMADQEAELEGQFTTGEGDLVDEPPAHPQCRCAVGLVFHRD